MPLKTVRVAQNQRGEAEDINDIGLLGLSNLTSALRGFVSPGTDGKMTRGGLVYPTAPASKNVLIQPSAGFNPSGLPILLEAEDTKAIADNASGNPRIDLVSISVVSVDTDEVPRKFWNPATEASFDAATDTRTELVTSVTVTQGVPGADPAPPATPAGHVPLAHVAVADGMTAIHGVDITPVDLSLTVPLKTRSWVWNSDYGVTGSDAFLVLPYSTPDLLIVGTSIEKYTVVLAQVYLKLLGSPVAHPFRVSLTATVQEPSPFTTVIGRAMFYHDVARPDAQTVTILGILQGLIAPVQIRLAISHATGAGPSAVSLNTEGAGAQLLINHIAALSL